MNALLRGMTGSLKLNHAVASFHQTNPYIKSLVEKEVVKKCPSPEGEGHGKKKNFQKEDELFKTAITTKKAPLVRGAFRGKM